MNNSALKLILISCLLLCCTISFAQDTLLNTRLSAERNKNTKYILDYRYKGGSGAFERDLNKALEYPDEARKNCIIGTVVLSFTVDCENNMGDLRMRNSLGMGFNEMFKNFYISTKDSWNRCSDNKYTKFDVPIMITIEGVETNRNALFTCEFESKGYRCKSDAYYLEEFEKLKVKKPKKALKMIDPLILRDPFNNTYYDLKKSLLENNE